jgi:hypothetical protein
MALAAAAQDVAKNPQVHRFPNTIGSLSEYSLFPVSL